MVRNRGKYRGRRKPKSDQEHPVRKETLKEYLARGGEITKVAHVEIEEIQTLRVKKG